MIPKLIMAGALILAPTVNVFAQNALQFTGVNATSENAIQLHWASNTNEIYEIDEADQLAGNPDGSTAWNTLYEDYPSQGTNTFWLDTGNYFADPEILHPSQMPMRFYRVVLTGTNTTPTVPTVSIISPTNSTTTNGDLTVTVTASSDQFYLSTKLYVDGQEMNEADVSTNWTDSGTNYVLDTFVINSCEWPNGSHTLFATAYCQSGASGTHNISDVAIGYGVSPFVPVNFDNLITRISFSQPFFTPEDGQTQQVSAVFAANSDWTLQIQDVSSNTVRTATGSGTSMQFNWDGKDDSNADLPVGNYTYLITAQTNGSSSFSMMSSSSGGFSSSVSALSTASEEVTELWALSPESSAPLPLAIYPPGFNTNDFTIFEASQSEVQALTEAVMSVDKPVKMAKSTMLMDSESSGGSASAMDASTPSGQAARAPTRPPINPVKGRAGVYGYAYDTYSANGPHFQLGPPSNGLLGHVGLEGNVAGQSTFNYDPLPEYKRESANFVEAMKKGNWSQGFAKVDDHWSINDLRGSGSIFNGVKLGLLLLHGTYGTTADSTSGANGCKQMYFPITAGQSAQYIRMSEMSLGGSAANGLKWMAIAACNSLFHTDWSNMQSLGVKPYNSNLHLLLGTGTVVYTDDHIMELWAKYMTKGSSGTPMTVRDAWINAAHDAYHNSHYPYANTMIFAAAGDSSCMGDTLNVNSTPGGSWTYYSQQVWP